MNCDWIKQDIINYCNEIINKYLYMKFPFRAVMIKTNFCYCCKTYSQTMQLREDSFSGLYNNYSWIYCKKCKIYVELADNFLYNNTNYVQYDKCKNLEKNHYNFFRVSSNLLVKPYIQKECYFNFRNGDYIKDLYNRVSMTISWKSYKDELCKNIPLANLIFFNRKIFGYNYNNFPLKDLPKKWTNLIKTEYNLSNEWRCLLIIIYKKTNLPKDVIKIIFKFWNSLYKY